jgi:acetolactate synthase-1/2/3 large subunit
VAPGAFLRMKLSDYVMDFLHREGTSHVFTVSGGGIMHLLDSLGRHPHLRYVCNYHEQASAIAAEGYSRVRGTLGACLVTTGPGSTNALSGVAGAWVDSIPFIVISGQVRRDLMADYDKVRQLGPQEINIDDMARPVTKYFCTVMEPQLIRQELEKAVAIARAGRPGPVWINIPLDVQGATIDESRLQPWDGAEVKAQVPSESKAAAQNVLALLQRSHRPVLIPGNGVHLANALPRFHALVERLQVPVVGTIGSADALHETHPSFMGRFGPLGQRRANFVVQNADLIVALGASLSVASVGFNTDAFAPRATKVMVNIDPHEIEKTRPVPDVAIVDDVGAFIDAMLAEPQAGWNGRLDPWLNACRRWRREYPPITKADFEDREYVNSYVFADVLSDVVEPGETVLTGNSLDWWSVYQAFKVKEGQRVFTNVNFGAMGWDLPTAIGACIGRDRRRTVLVTGDGTIQFNIHELQTIAHNALPVKIFVLNNGGYTSIRTMQDTHFAGTLVGAGPSSGVSNPNFERLASAYALRYAAIRTNDDLAATMRTVLQGDDPVLCEVHVNPAQGRYPRIMSRRREDGTMESGTLENMYPFLPSEEVSRNMRMFDSEE